MEPEHRRGYGVLYDAINHGQIETEQLRKLVITMPVPTFSLQNGSVQTVLAVDLSNWLRPDAVCAPDRVFCHIYARNG
ncbi:transposase [Glutamicibacter sp. NPDC127525]|uniref:transposase n=1 Tax=unclassified Glutamicibacter TaxID=2627139 RepID=UPI003638B814